MIFDDFDRANALTSRNHIGLFEIGVVYKIWLPAEIFVDRPSLLGARLFGPHPCPR